MGQYRIFHVVTYKARPGQRATTEKWWNDTGKAFVASMPGVTSVNAYVSQFGLGHDHDIEVWLELENYAAYDRIDQDVSANRQKYAPFAQMEEFFESGPSRIVGDWPASDLIQGS